jgi:predicted AAA+ superfamily ATPase
MERFAIQELIKWKEKEGRKLLIIRGARQVGKTWLMKEFGKAHYNKTVYVNFESSKLLQTVFSADYDIQRIITALQIETGVQIEAKNTLIIFDEIQDAKGAITSLKYFFENAPEYHIIAAGSLLGVALHENISFPVGKVEFLDISPLNYAEFLLANKQTELYNLLNSNDWNLTNSFKSKYIRYLRQYYFTGGMPEVVQSFVDNNNFNDVRDIQNRILRIVRT